MGYVVENRLHQMNFFERDCPAKPPCPTVGSLRPGNVFQFPSGNALYVRTDQRRSNECGCVHFGTGVFYWCEETRPVTLLPKGEQVRLTVNTQ